MSRRVMPSRTIGVVCAMVATALGVAYLVAVDAPSHYPLVNCAAFLVGLGLCFAVARRRARIVAASGATLVAIGTLLLVTLLGVTVEGATRWIRIGPISMQPSLILVPALLLVYAARPSRLATAGVALAALGLALQPDRGMAAVLVAGLAVIAFRKREPQVFQALGVGLMALTVTLVRSDDVAPAEHVEHVARSAFAHGVPIGVVVVAGLGVLLAPAFSGSPDPSTRRLQAVFGVTWLAVVAAAILGNYPTPVVGYGASGVLGYLLSVAVLPLEGSPEIR